jgi:hypothetical protein
LVITTTTVVVVAFLHFVSDTPWFRYPLPAILAYGIAMTAAVIMRRIAPLSLPESHFRLKPFEDEGRLYVRAGIQTFRNLLVVTRIDACNRLVRFSGHRTGLQDLARGTRQAEAEHLVSFLVVLLAFVYTFTRGWFEVAFWLAVVNVLANVYPVMLQRHNRARIEAVLRRPR